MLNQWPPLGTLRGFEAAARLGSFHKAAEELHLTQSAISQQIRSLEAYLEQPLFFRSGRSVSLTDAGQISSAPPRPYCNNWPSAYDALGNTANLINWCSTPRRPLPGIGCCLA